MAAQVRLARHSSDCSTMWLLLGDLVMQGDYHPGRMRYPRWQRSFARALVSIRPAHMSLCVPAPPPSHPTDAFRCGLFGGTQGVRRLRLQVSFMPPVSLPQMVLCIWVLPFCGPYLVAFA
eukprot:7380211-Pyramimonas_sp.AAC.1